MADQDITTAVRDKYAATARSSLTNEHAGVQAVAVAFGYSPEELRSIPAEANMGLSCGNPVALAHLKPGEVVVDLGSGGGLDVFLAAQKVGPTGKAIGIDMTPDMVERARRAAAKGAGGRPITNVEFHLAKIDEMPLPDASADVILSNCVINLAPDKRSVFAEMFRVLKPGGRVAVSDIALKKKLPKEISSDVMAYIGCIAGAIRVEEYEAGLRAAGFSDVVIVDSGADLNAYSQVEGQSGCCTPAEAVPARSAAVSSCCGGGKSAPAAVATSCCGPSATGAEAKAAVHEHLADLLSRYNVNDYAASVKVFAVKPK